MRIITVMEPMFHTVIVESVVGVVVVAHDGDSGFWKKRLRISYQEIVLE